jgi:uncharacterized coiled-coil DUF342 family protein
MYKFLTLLSLSMLLVWTATSCVSTQELQALNQEKTALKNQIARLKAQNEELSNERFSYTSIIETKRDQINKVAEKYQAEAVILQQKYDQLQQDFLKTKEELNKKHRENESLRQEMLTNQQAGMKETEELRGKLKWAYSKLYGGRSK